MPIHEDFFQQARYVVIRIDLIKEQDNLARLSWVHRVSLLKRLLLSYHLSFINEIYDFFLSNTGMYILSHEFGIYDFRQEIYQRGLADTSLAHQDYGDVGSHSQVNQHELEEVVQGKHKVVKVRLLPHRLPVLVAHADVEYLLDYLLMCHFVILLVVLLLDANFELPERFGYLLNALVYGSDVGLLADDKQRDVVDLPLEFIEALGHLLDLVPLHVLELSRLGLLEFLHYGDLSCHVEQVLDDAVVEVSCMLLLSAIFNV